MGLNDDRFHAAAAAMTSFIRFVARLKIVKSIVAVMGHKFSVGQVQSTTRCILACAVLIYHHRLKKLATELQSSGELNARINFNAKSMPYFHNQSYGVHLFFLIIYVHRTAESHLLTKKVKRGKKTTIITQIEACSGVACLKYHTI